MRATVVRWSDGDTVVTDKGKVRLIGVDTQELGRCGSVAAKRRAVHLAPVGSTIRLVDPRSVRDKDRYGRLLRYVQVGGRDVSMVQIRAGALARYDSRMGYDRHPRQGAYVRADRANGSPCRPPPTRAAGVAPRAVAGLWGRPMAGATVLLVRPSRATAAATGGSITCRTTSTYGVTNPEECFATEAAAQRAGYRAARI